MPEVWLIAEFTARPGAEEDVAALVGEFAARVRAEPGNLLFRPTTRELDSSRWVVLEAYADHAAFEAHLGADYGDLFNQRLTPLIEEPASALTMLRPI